MQSPCAELPLVWKHNPSTQAPCIHHACLPCSASLLTFCCGLSLDWGWLQSAPPWSQGWGVTSFRWLPLWCFVSTCLLAGGCRFATPVPMCWPGAEGPDQASWSPFWGTKCFLLASNGQGEFFKTNTVEKTLLWQVKKVITRTWFFPYVGTNQGVC